MALQYTGAPPSKIDGGHACHDSAIIFRYLAFCGAFGCPPSGLQ
jgi:hypothetical protein